MKRILLVLLIAIVALPSLSLALLLARVPILLAIGGFLIVEDELVPSDLIHVISGPNSRIDHGIRLYQEGYGRELFFTGRGNHASSARRRAIRQGVPEEAVFADGWLVTSTYSEALRLKAFIDASPTPVHSVILVTDPHHTRRARWAYRQVLGNGVQVQMAPVPFQSSRYERRWWTDERSRKMVAGEYVKFFYYCLRYRWSWGRFREWLGSLDQG